MSDKNLVIDKGCKLLISVFASILKEELIFSNLHLP